MAVKADLEQLDKLRHYLIFGAQCPISTRLLIEAIDDHVEKLTGDRTTPHSRGHLIG